MSHKLYLVLLLLVSATSQAFWGPIGEKPSSVWHPQSLPVEFVMDVLNLPNNISNTSANRALLKSSISAWNEDESLGTMLYIIDGTVSGTHETGNGVNEIKFTEWDYAHWTSNAAAITVTRKYLTSVRPCVQLPDSRWGCVNEREESDILFRPVDIPFYLGDSVPSGCAQNPQVSANTVLRHEIGHALGIKHYGNKLMQPEIPHCKNYSVSRKDIKVLKQMYPSLDTVNVSVLQPYLGQAIIGNQPFTFTAQIEGFGRWSDQTLPPKQIKSIEDGLVWTSSIDGEIGQGNDVSITDLAGGFHEIRVSVGQPGDAVYGDGFTTVFVIDTVFDLLDSNGHQIAGPYPCPRRVNSSTGSCLFTYKDSILWNLSTCLTYPQLSALYPPYVEDVAPGQFDGEGHEFTTYVGDFPICSDHDGSPDNVTQYHDIAAWIRDTHTNDKVNYHLFSAWTNPYTLNDPNRILNVYIEDLLLVEPEIYIHPMNDCQVSNVTEKCSTSVSFDSKYFLPDAGLYYKPLGASNSAYRLAARLPEESAGTVNTGQVIDVDGLEFAVFQYSRDVKKPGDIFTNLINAPDGLVAGPFVVRAISNDTTPTDPDLQAVQTTCSNNYCIELMGEHFGTNSYVDIHVDLNGGGFLKRIAGNDIYSRSEEHIMFPIQDLSLQNRLRQQGLCFWVVNPPEFSEGKCVTRPVTPDPEPFMGQIVESYEAQDIEYTSFEVNNNGTELSIWGNSWKKIAANYTVTPNTVLEFQFKSIEQQARINGVAFIREGSSGINASHAWQVYGTREDWGNQSHHDYTGNQWKTYRIPIGESFTGLISDMVFIGDEDQHVGQHVIYRQPRLFEDLPSPVISSVEATCANNYCINVMGQNFAESASVIVRENTVDSNQTKEYSGADIYSRTPVNGQERIYIPTRDPMWQHKFNTNGLCFKVLSLNKISNEVCLSRPMTEPMGTFNDSFVEGEPSQDLEPNAFEVTDNNLLKTWGNSWKKIDRQYTVTLNTVLEFDFKSDREEAALNGIGLIMDGESEVSANRVWQVHGTRNDWGLQTHHNYSGTDWQTYQIPVGETFTGLVSELVFIADEDNHVGHNSLFKNVRLRESVPSMITGYVYDPIYSGHGLHLSKNLAGTHLVMFFSYDHNGKPEWFMSHNTQFINNKLSGEFLKVTFDHAMAQTATQNVGHFSIDYSSSAVDGNVNCNGVDRSLQPAAFQWSINGQVGLWCVQPVFKQSDGSISIPAKNSGVWYQQNSPGWGMTLQTRLMQGTYDSYAAMFFYDNEGQPRWAAAPAEETGIDQYSYNMAHHNGYRRNTTGSATQVISGMMNLDFRNVSEADFDIEYPLPPMGRVSRTGATMNRLAY